MGAVDPRELAEHVRTWTGADGVSVAESAPGQWTAQAADGSTWAATDQPGSK